MATTTSPIKLESNRGARFSNTAHAKFHQTQYDLISKADLPKINVSPDMLKASAGFGHNQGDACQRS